MILQVSYKNRLKLKEGPDDVVVVSEVGGLYLRRLKLPCVHICL